MKFYFSNERVTEYHSKLAKPPEKKKQKKKKEVIKTKQKAMY